MSDQTTECEGCGKEMRAIDNPFGDGTIGPTKCDDCLESEQQERERRKRKQRRRELRPRLEQANYPQHWLLNPTDPPDTFKPFVERDYPSRENGLFLCGAKGAGKTFTALALGKRWLEVEFVEKGREGTDLLFVCLPELIARQFDDKSMLYRSMDAECLILDDIGAEAPNGYVSEMVCTLLDKRERSAMPTIMTSNVMPADLMGDDEGDGGGYDARMMRRIKSMCGGSRNVAGYYSEGELYR